MIMQIAYGATAVPLTERGLGHFFRICPRDDNQAKAAVRVMQKMKMFSCYFTIILSFSAHTKTLNN
jgi:ABC-type branched-subunit amino acid transport system substrate-binding protein